MTAHQNEEMAISNDGEMVLPELPLQQAIAVVLLEGRLGAQPGDLILLESAKRVLVQYIVPIRAQFDAAILNPVFLPKV